jgi:hypothetical protein
MIAELERIIRAEEAKPEAERDLALIDDCIKEIAEIKGVKAEFSEEEVAQITDKLIQTAEKTKKRKRFVRLVAGIAAMFVIVTGVTACAVNPALVNWFKMIVRMPFGASIEQEKVTYIHHGSSEEFNSIEDLFFSNSLNVYYPTILPDGIKLKSIEVVDENDVSIMSFSFTSTEFRYTIQSSNPDFKWEQDIVYNIERDGLHFDVCTEENSYISHSNIEGNTYIIQANSVNDIILVIGGLRKVIE